MTEEKESIEKETEAKPTDDLSVTDKLQKERDEYLAGWQRAKADFSNYQKNEARRNEEFAKWALASLTAELLPILDSFEIALKQSSSDTEQMGLKLIRSQLISTLSKYGLSPIVIEKGANFNPEFHEAVSREESSQPEDTIIEEAQTGYTLHSRVLRPAKVKVSTKKAET